jgi:chromosome transmission fidelity protein 4
MFLDIARDALGDELTTEDISKQETALDMELIKLLGKACSSNLDRPTRQARALDIARLIHNPGIFESAIKVAQFYKLRGLEDRIGRVKAMREDEDRLRTARDRRRDWAGDVAPVAAPVRPAHGTAASSVRAFDDFDPPAAVARPGLARVKVAGPAASSSPWASSSEDALGAELAPDGEGKRKRTPDDDPPAVDLKRRAFGALPAQSEYSWNELGYCTHTLPEANPFARKPAADSSTDPFTRDQGKKTVRKSESFFNKVEAAETGGTARE